ncbi:hypothetical protein QE381_000564 [Microbacterium sp. SORGH_AS 888]|nr:hypothetical protein [Microbacterium sp. SORGH_AS_0888]
MPAWLKTWELAEKRGVPMSDQPPQNPEPQYSAPQPPAPGAYPPPAAPAYGAPVYGAAPVSQKTNVMAILSLVFAFVFAILGVVFGHIALGQIKRTGEQGRGLAIAGLVIGYIAIAFWVIYIIALIVIAITVGSSSYYSY